jgi:hypothetical protein
MSTTWRRSSVGARSPVFRDRCGSVPERPTGARHAQLLRQPSLSRSESCREDHPPRRVKVGRPYLYRFHATGYPAPIYRLAAATCLTGCTSTERPAPCPEGQPRAAHSPSPWPLRTTSHQQPSGRPVEPPVACEMARLKAAGRQLPDPTEPATTLTHSRKAVVRRPRKVPRPESGQVDGHVRDTRRWAAQQPISDEPA